MYAQIFVCMTHKKNESVFLTGIPQSGKLSENPPHIMTDD